MVIPPQQAAAPAPIPQPVMPEAAQPLAAAAPQPVVLAPAGPAPVPTVSAQTAMPAIGMTGSSLATGPGSRNKLLLGLLGGAGAVAVVAIVLFMFVLHPHVSAQDITKAHDNISTIGNDITDASFDLEDATTADTADGMSSKLGEANSKIAEAEKRYDELKSSPVIKDGSVKPKFEALDAKWGPFLTYVKNDAKDTAKLAPLLQDFQTSMKSLSDADVTSTAGLGTFLTQFKTNIDSLSTKVSASKMADADNQKIVDALHTFLQSASANLATAQSDLSSGKSVFDVSDDIFKVDDASSTMYDTMNDIKDNINKKTDQLDPIKQLSDLQIAVAKLGTKVTAS